MIKLSGFTIVRNARLLEYPVIEAITSILPICDEFIVNVGNSDDDTLALIQSINSPKIKIIQTPWDFTKGNVVLSEQTNIALSHCRGKWAFYLQGDEVIHEDDLAKIKQAIDKAEQDPSIDVIRLGWFHFYGSFWRYRIDAGWYQKQDRIIRNNGAIESWGDAYSFRRSDGKELKRLRINAYVYHYGWVYSKQQMQQRCLNARLIGYEDSNKTDDFLINLEDDIEHFEPYFGTHPQIMRHRIDQHEFSQRDKALIAKKYWWHPGLWFKSRIKTSKRIKVSLLNESSPGSGIKLNLGCGTQKLPGWMNIDAVSQCQPDLVHDLSKPLPFNEGAVARILARDLLEHFDKYQRYLLLYDWARVLRVGGMIQLQVPDVQKIVRKYHKFKFDDFVDTLYGENMWQGKIYNGHYGNHKWGYSHESLQQIMRLFGFDTITIKTKGLNIIYQGIKQRTINREELLAMTITSHANRAIGQNQSMTIAEVIERIGAFDKKSQDSHC